MRIARKRAREHAHKRQQHTVKCLPPFPAFPPTTDKDNKYERMRCHLLTSCVGLLLIKYAHHLQVVELVVRLRVVVDAVMLVLPV